MVYARIHVSACVGRAAYLSIAACCVSVLKFSVKRTGSRGFGGSNIFLGRFLPANTCSADIPIQPAHGTRCKESCSCVAHAYISS